MKILFIGDSITDCGRIKDQDLSLGQGYVLMVAGELSHGFPERSFDFLNRGISGNKITDLLARWRRDCINLEPDLVSILVGVNDIWHEFNRQDGVSAEMYERLYDIVLEDTRAGLPNAKIVLCEPFAVDAEGIKDVYPHIKPGLDVLQLVVRRLADNHGCTFLPLQDAFNRACKTNRAEYWLHDGVHPSPAGHMLIAQEWIKTVDLS